MVQSETKFYVSVTWELNTQNNSHPNSSHIFFFELLSFLQLELIKCKTISKHFWIVFDRLKVIVRDDLLTINIQIIWINLTWHNELHRRLLQQKSLETVLYFFFYSSSFKRCINRQQVGGDKQSHQVLSGDILISLNVNWIITCMHHLLLFFSRHDVGDRSPWCSSLDSCDTRCWHSEV